jgi:hypothetical protein
VVWYVKEAAVGKSRKNVLIVNCFFDYLRVPVKRRFKIPLSMGPAYLAGLFSAERCEVRLYDEVYSGPLEDERILSFPDMLVLTGLNVAFDRMLHLTAYVKTKNKKAIAVAGGPAIRALTEYSKEFFDYCCTGDLEQLRDVIEDAFGLDFVSRTYLDRGWIIPRFDLAYWMKWLAYVETSRNCYFRCSFCSLTAENACYKPYDIEYIRYQFMKLGRRGFIHFLDNNFASNDKKFLLDRFELLKELHDSGQVPRWAAEVTSDFFHDDENLSLAAGSGCTSLFCGIESFDQTALSTLGKRQNTVTPQVEMIQRSLHANIGFYYGIVFDFTSRTVSEMDQELEFMIGTPEIPLPSFITLAIPLLKTPFFHACIENGRFLPNLRLRDLDGATIVLRPKDEIREAVEFLMRLQNLKGYRLKIARHTKNFIRLYKDHLSLENMAISLSSALLLCAQGLTALGSNMGKNLFGSGKRQRRTYVGSTDPLDAVYRPSFPVHARYRRYFEPTRLTDEDGNICGALQRDLIQP